MMMVTVVYRDKLGMDGRDFKTWIIPIIPQTENVDVQIIPHYPPRYW